jgi:hypothetical protein
LVVFRSLTGLVGKTASRPYVLSVHILPEEIDPAQADIKAVDGLLHLHMSKKNNRKVRVEHASATGVRFEGFQLLGNNTVGP